jgi:hypothetical protein
MFYLFRSTQLHFVRELLRKEDAAPVYTSRDEQAVHNCCLALVIDAVTGER